MQGGVFGADETCGVPFSPGFVIFLFISAVAATLVSLDYGARTEGSPWERLAWFLGTLLALPIFLPIYLIAARPPGRLVRCPSCGRLTLTHRAACRHCGNAIAFEPSPRIWGLGEVVGIALVFMVTLPVVAAALGIQGTPSLVELSGLALAQNLMFIGLAIYVVRIRYQLPLADLGVRLERWPTWAAAGLLIGALSIPVSTQVEALAIALISLFIGRGNAEQMAEQEHLSDVLTGILQDPISMPEFAWILFLVCVLVPIGEEIFFRGFVYGTLRRWGVATAVVLSALFFSAVHQQIVHFLPILVLGIVLALAYERTGSLLPAMVIHAVNNVVAILSVYYGWNI
jgi:membrane protease YdiL (CAAX protease family)